MHSTKMIGMMIVRGTRSTCSSGRTRNRPKNRMPRWPAWSSPPRRRRTAACLIISIGPGCTPWMIIAAISTAAGAEPGMPSASAGMMPPGIAGVVAGLGRHQALDRALAELLLLLADALGGGVGRPGAPCPRRRRAGCRCTTPITPERRMVRQYWSTSRDARQHRVHALTIARCDRRRPARSGSRRSRRRRPAPGSARCRRTGRRSRR